MDSNFDHSENKQIEQYIKQYCLEECLDEALNVVVTNRSNNPYTAMSEAILMKSLPEIIDIYLHPVIVRATYAIKATLITSIGSFSATSCYYNKTNSQQAENAATNASTDETLEAPDLMALEQKVREVLVAVDPRNVALVDEALLRVHNIRQEESLAISMAATKAAAKYYGCTIYELIADLAETKREDLIVPQPVTTIAARVVNTTAPNNNTAAANPPTTPGNKGKDKNKDKDKDAGAENKESGIKFPVMQCVQIYPCRSSTVESTIQAILNINRAFHKLEKLTGPKKMTSFGCMLVEGTNTLEDLVQVESIQFDTTHFLIIFTTAFK